MNFQELIDAAIQSLPDISYAKVRVMQSPLSGVIQKSINSLPPEIDNGSAESDPAFFEVENATN
jgi:hypothetical protein